MGGGGACCVVVMLTTWGTKSRWQLRVTLGKTTCFHLMNTCMVKMTISLLGKLPATFTKPFKVKTRNILLLCKRLSHLINSLPLQEHGVVGTSACGTQHFILLLRIRKLWFNWSNWAQHGLCSTGGQIRCSNCPFWGLKLLKLWLPGTFDNKWLFLCRSS